MLIPGSSRSSQAGIHQFQRPMSSIAAGTKISRTSVASMKIANASPSPNSLITRSSLSRKERKTVTKIAAAAVITRALAPIPCATDSLALPVSK